MKLNNPSNRTYRSLTKFDTRIKLWHKNWFQNLKKDLIESFSQLRTSFATPLKMNCYCHIKDSLILPLIDFMDDFLEHLLNWTEFLWEQKKSKDDFTMTVLGELSRQKSLPAHVKVPTHSRLFQSEKLKLSIQ